MTQCIINGFELVHVEEEHSDLVFRIASFQLPAEMTAQEGSIRELRKGVIRGQSN